jgi:hypothetical protein
MLQMNFFLCNLHLYHRLLIPDRTLERDVKKLIKDRILTNLKVP